MKHIALIPALALLCACSDLNMAEEINASRYAAGEALMNDCAKRKQRCDQWRSFKAEWEKDADYVMTFEEGLARHKAGLI